MFQGPLFLVFAVVCWHVAFVYHVSRACHQSAYPFAQVSLVWLRQHGGGGCKRLVSYTSCVSHDHSGGYTTREVWTSNNVYMSIMNVFAAW